MPTLPTSTQQRYENLVTQQLSSNGKFRLYIGLEELDTIKKDLSESCRFYLDVDRATPLLNRLYTPKAAEVGSLVAAKDRICFFVTNARIIYSGMPFLNVRSLTSVSRFPQRLEIRITNSDRRLLFRTTSEG